MFNSMLRQGSRNIDVFDKVRGFSDLTMTTTFSVADKKTNSTGPIASNIFIVYLLDFRTGARTMDTDEVRKKDSPPFKNK